MKITIFPGKYNQNCGFSMAMLVSGRVPDMVFPFLSLMPRLKVEMQDVTIGHERQQLCNGGCQV